MPKIRRDKEKTESKPDPKKDLARMNQERDEKIRRYKESKAIEESLNELKLAIDRPSCDEDVLRDYYIKMIKKWDSPQDLFLYRVSFNVRLNFADFHSMH